jgi:hypothetical protein
LKATDAQFQTQPAGNATCRNYSAYEEMENSKRAS